MMEQRYIDLGDHEFIGYNSPNHALSSPNLIIFSFMCSLVIELEKQNKMLPNKLSHFLSVNLLSYT